MDNLKNLESDNNNSGGVSPTSVPGVPDANTADVSDDLSMKNDEDLFGEPIEEDQDQKQELPLPLEKESEQHQVQEQDQQDQYDQQDQQDQEPQQDQQDQEPQQEQQEQQDQEPQQPEKEQQEQQELLQLGQQQQNQELLQQDQDPRNIELPSKETGSQDEDRIKDKDDNIEENKAAEANPQVESEPDVKIENEESVSGGNNGDKDEKVDENENQKEHENENNGNDNNTYNNNNGVNNDNTNQNNQNNGNDATNNHGNDNGVNENGDKSEEKPSVGIEQENEGKQSKNSLEQYPPPPPASELSKPAVPTTAPPTNATKTTTHLTATDDNDLAVPQSHEIVIPNYAKWFNLTKIHPIEKQSLPEFFTNRIPSKTPQVYVKSRNFMVNSYRLNPNEYFSVTTARRNVCGDAAAVFRIHKFLMKWGLINYQVDAQLLPKSVEPPFTGEYSTRHDAPRGLFPFESYKPSVQLPDMAKLKKMMDTDDSSSALHKYLKEEKRKSQSAITSSPEIKDEDKEKGRTNEDNGEEEPVENPHGAKRPKVVKASTNVDDGWQENDVEKLLKGIQMHGSEWYKIAKEVGNKTPEQCILKFIQMPIEDKFLHRNSEDGSDLGSLKYAPHLPFSKSENPVMSTLAFLVGLVDPKVVQHMTDRALRKLEPKEEDNKSSLSPSEPPPPPTAKEASQLAISSLGVRSHVFANNEERQMTSIAHQMAQVQLQKVEVKLKLLDKVEKSLELEKKTLQRQQEDVLVQRISLAKHTKNISQKLEDSLTCFEDKEKLSRYVEEIKSLVSHPPKLSIGSAFANSETTAQSGISTNRSEEDVKPVSVEAPQSYRYWSA
ncbi:ZYRO0C08008p [Zygosaccharomyces rouxii]|uniref:ZYRO0C08008p n=1 Tax=Zygosaccharomyces rouxii (strain ATCC 2623 / CBS 732 / NBRC 1130 / NCYC 568 / NRRL Y-229) TaxID=559307 RepID=C5DTF0_ZYGRC|nr:uncharacterized protein ZYRO0C08008g [Zygosaccharomyces rouxii]KAH9201758.1 SWIRM domain-containing protein [Zygosaccharomyces rouxii]CAR27061.1 ZYRO0C08008p [Zygosaccharomyces rouxii]